MHLISALRSAFAIGVASLVAILTTGCQLGSRPITSPGPTDPPNNVQSPGAAPAPSIAPDGRPLTFTIRPDDYHVPYAGTAEDGRKFFLSNELFEPGGSSYVGLYLWKPDGTFDTIKVDAVPRPDDVPTGMAAPADADQLLAKRLEELGDYTLEPITVEPFIRKIDGVAFGWQYTKFQGTRSLHIEPGNFIAYYEPWDGWEYDT